MSTTLHARIKMRADTAANWTANNPTLAEREIGIELDPVTAPDGTVWRKAKIGPGQWAALPYLSFGVPSATLQNIIDLIAAHVIDTDPHGDRAYAAGLVGQEVIDRNTAIAQALVGLWNDRGNWDASGGGFPSNGSGTGGAVMKGDIWTVSVAGTAGTEPADQFDTVRALTDSPASQADWAIGEGNVEQASELQRGTAKVVTTGTIQDAAATNDTDLVTAKKWWQAWSYAIGLTAFGNTIRNLVLTGWTVGANAAVTAADTISEAIGHLQGQINALTGTPKQYTIINMAPSDGLIPLGRVNVQTTILGIDLICATGSFKATIKINGSTVTGLNAVTTTASWANTAATGANVAAQWAELSLEISSTSTTPPAEGGQIIIYYTEQP